VAIEKCQERGKGMHHEQGRSETQAVFHGAIHIDEANPIPLHGPENRGQSAISREPFMSIGPPRAQE
jgi:hypothetical protein